jgi:hypothetical protein
VSDSGRFDARELFNALARHEVDYVTIGGIAVQAHGGQRLTLDLDIAILPAPDNLERLAGALAEVDARILGPGGERSASPPTSSLLGSSDQWHLITDHGALDVISPPAHLGPFDEMLARAHRIALGDVTVPIAHRKDLIKMKRASNRAQDRADVELLEALDKEL